MTNIQEIWKPIPGYEGLYEISNLGKVKSLKRFVNHNRGGLMEIQEKLISISVHKQGHHVVRLWKNNKTRLFNIYRLLAIVFIPNPENKLQVNHIDGNRRAFPRLENLEWCTASENMKHAFKTGLTRGNFKPGFEHQFAKLNKEDVKGIYLMRKNGNSLVEIGVAFNINWCYASQILNNKKYENILSE